MRSVATAKPCPLGALATRRGVGSGEHGDRVMPSIPWTRHPITWRTRDSRRLRAPASLRAEHWPALTAHGCLRTMPRPAVPARPRGPTASGADVRAEAGLDPPARGSAYAARTGPPPPAAAPADAAARSRPPRTAAASAGSRSRCSPTRSRASAGVRRWRSAGSAWRTACPAAHRCCSPTAIPKSRDGGVRARPDRRERRPPTPLTPR